MDHELTINSDIYQRVREDLEKCSNEMFVSHFVGMPGKEALYGTAPIPRNYIHYQREGESKHNSNSSKDVVEERWFSKLRSLSFLSKNRSKS